MLACRSQACVVLLEDRHHLRSAKLGWYVRIGREHLTLRRARDRNVMLGIVGTGLRRRHSVALPAVKSDVDLQRLGMKCTRPQLIEDVMRIEGTVVVADAGVVAPDDKVPTAEVLANEGMKQRLAWTGIAHLDRIARLDYRSRAEIIVDHRLDCAGTNIGWGVAWFQFPTHLMDAKPVPYLNRDFYQVIVATGHGISRLEGGDIGAAARGKHGPRLGGPGVAVPVFGR